MMRIKYKEKQKELLKNFKYDRQNFDFRDLKNHIKKELRMRKSNVIDQESNFRLLDSSVSSNDGPKVVNKSNYFC